MTRAHWQEKAVRLMLQSAAFSSLLIVLLIFVFLGRESVPFLYDPGVAELFRLRWNPVSFEREMFGILPLLTGSLLVTALATILAVPFGVCAAVYIAEIARPVEREFFKPFIELLAGIPSVVIGFFGLVVVAPLVKGVFHLQTGLTALTGALLLALMAIPTIISISEDAIRSVPTSFKEASLALGASRLQTIWKVTIPAALSGIVAAVMLGIGRVIGETMAVMIATIAAEMGEVPFGSHHYHALFCIGVVLLLLTFGLNMIAQKVLKRYRIGS
jgi:phosphate transport system permease protein